MNFRICITGPEATGKSSLAESLAERFSSPWVPEFARSYLAKLGRPYRESDLDDILRGQLSLEERLAGDSDGILFCDTGPEVIWVWSHYKYGRVSPFIDQITRSHEYRFTLLLNTDLPWTPDPLRENPSEIERRILLQQYQLLLKQIGRKHAIISGNGASRTKHAIQILQQIEGSILNS